MSNNTQFYLNQINDDHKFIYTLDLHKKMYESFGGNLKFINKENFRKLGKHAYYANINTKIFPQFDGNLLLEECESILDRNGSLKVGTKYIQIISNKSNTEPFFISEDEIDVNYKFETNENGIKFFGSGYAMVTQIKK